MFSENEVEINVLKLSGDISNGKLSIVKLFSQENVTTQSRLHKIKLYPNVVFQTLEGLGGAFNEIGGQADINGFT